MLKLIICLVCATASQLLNITRIPATNAPPTSRIYHFIDYNDITKQIIIFGGSQDSNTVYNDVWSFDIAKGLYTCLVPTNNISPGNA